MVSRARAVVVVVEDRVVVVGVVFSVVAAVTREVPKVSSALGASVDDCDIRFTVAELTEDMDNWGIGAVVLSTFAETTVVGGSIVVV